MQRKYSGGKGGRWHGILWNTGYPHVNSDPHSPFGLNRTTLTAAECRLRVVRYSTLGGLKGFVASEPPAAALSAKTDAGMMFGYIIHNCHEPIRATIVSCKRNRGQKSRKDALGHDCLRHRWPSGRIGWRTPCQRLDVPS